MVEENYTVYKHVNKLNGKVYIGITSGDVRVRWHYGHGYKNSPHFWAAIQKYGWNGFDHIIIKTGLSKEAACYAERKLVKRYKARDPQYGYNILTGGDIGPKGRVQSEEERERRRISAKKAWSDPKLRAEQSERLKGRVMSEETRAKLREAGKRRDPPSAEQRAQISKTLKKYFSNPENRKRLSDAKPKNAVICIETGEIYSSSHEAHRKTGVVQGNIYACCLGKRNRAGGFHWAFYEPVAC